MTRAPNSESDDAVARRQAIDVRESFIVQAPAGSGKTELLIQRLLALLARVDYPEELVAITFTRKAAAEMKARLLDALRRAREDPQPEPDHEARTWRLARAVISRDQEKGWRLETESQQLRIDTVDALNGWLARRLPLAAGAVAGLELLDDARRLYQLAARRTVASLGNDDHPAESVRALLMALDTRLPRLEKLLAELAPRRDQWLRHIRPGAATDAVRQELELALERLVDDHLNDLQRRFPADLLRIARELLEHSGKGAALAGSDLGHWQAIAALLLTQKGAWRRQVTVREGFPREDRDAKTRFAQLIADLEPLETLRDALAEVPGLPRPRYEPREWLNLEALRQVLHHLIAQLSVVFQEAEACDFVEIAMAARRALGATDAPSDLLLAMDRRIQHILVDEFQDTSHTQLHLLETLTAGWQPGDGRTLFLVGDPMQSIYRFRDADMALFLRVKQNGLGDVRLRSLTLHRNFRSDVIIVDWVNNCFASCMPGTDDIGSGAAAYVAAAAVRSGSHGAGVEVHLLAAGEAAEEAARVAELIRAELDGNQNASLAVLVQARPHLAGLQSQLRAMNINVQAVEIESANQYQVIQDLIGLTRALLHPEDRIAWLAVLRMPFCGVTLVDLAALCESDHKTPVWTLLNAQDSLAALSTDGQIRIQALREALHNAFAERGSYPLSIWVERTWCRIGAALILDDNGRAQAQQFFLKLADLTRQGDLDDPCELETAFLEPQVIPGAVSDARVQIMTVHRAKGLEFDTVIFMGLGRSWPGDDSRALRWLERSTATGGEDLLLAPLKDGAADNALHDFIRREERARDDLERVRLAYVATTRARNRLHLVAQLPDANAATQRRSMLAHLGSAFQDRQPEPVAAPPAPVPLAPLLRRLETAPIENSPSVSTSADTAPPLTYEWVSQTAVHVGTVAHRWLQRLAVDGAEHWPATRIAALATRVRGELRLAGVDDGELPGACERVLAALAGSVADERGRWILSSGHEDAHAEFPLTLWTDAGTEQMVLDRTFIAPGGVRWIIDYKTSTHEGGGLDAFLDNEVERYRAQLERYARAMALLESRPTRVGLYFPLLAAFRAWEPLL